MAVCECGIECRAVGFVGVCDASRVAVTTTDEVHSVVEPEGDAGSDCDGELLERHQGTAKLGRCDLSLVEGNNHGEHSDSNTTYNTTREQHSGVLGSSL